MWRIVGDQGMSQAKLIWASPSVISLAKGIGRDRWLTMT